MATLASFHPHPLFWLSLAVVLAVCALIAGVNIAHHRRRRADRAREAELKDD